MKRTAFIIFLAFAIFLAAIPAVHAVSGIQASVATSVPSITVKTPNGGENWQRSTAHTVTWDYTGNPGSAVKIVLLKGSTEVGTICASTSTGSGGHGSYTWQIYPSGTTGSDFRVRVQSISQPAIQDASNNYFTITPAGTSAPTITLSSPNGGESWQRGTSHTVTWDYTGNPGSAVKIVLLKGSTEVGTVSASTSTGSGGHGSFPWLVPSTGLTGSDYKVSIQSLSQPALKDESNNFLTLTSGPSTPGITSTGSTVSGSGTTIIPSTTPTGKTLSMDSMASYNLPPFTFGTNDESAKVQSAINYAVANNYAVVQFPTGGKSISIGTKLNFPKTTANGTNITYVGNSCVLRMMAENFGHDEHYVNMYGKVTGMIFDGDRSYLAGVPTRLGGPGTTGENGVMMFSNSEMDGCIVRNFCSYTVSVFQVPGQTNIKITNNTIYNSWQYGICSGAGDPPPSAPFNSAITITGNRVYNCAEVGIKIRGVRGANVSDNTVTVGSQYGMASSASGIELYSDDGPNYNTVIDHNTIHGVGGYSIGIESDSSGTNQNITITNNAVTDCYVTMRLPNISGLTKSGNTCNGSTC